MYGSGLTHAHGTQHAYMGRGATPLSCMGFVCLNSHICFTGNKQRQVHYPKVNKKRKTNMPNGSNHQPKQTWCSYELKNDTYVWCPSGVLSSNFLMACTFCLPSLSLLVLVRLLPQGDLGLYLYFYLFYCAYIFNSQRIYVQTLHFVPLMTRAPIPPIDAEILRSKVGLGPNQTTN